MSEFCIQSSVVSEASLISLILMMNLSTCSCLRQVWCSHFGWFVFFVEWILTAYKRWHLHNLVVQDCAVKILTYCMNFYYIGNYSFDFFLNVLFKIELLVQKSSQVPHYFDYFNKVTMGIE